MLTNVDQLLLSQYLNVYQTLHNKLYHTSSKYVVISLNKDSILTSETVDKLRNKVQYKGTVYVVLCNGDPICYFTMLHRRTSCISSELIVKQLGYSTMYDSAELVNAITTFALLTLYERKIYTVNKIWFYINKHHISNGKLYQHGILHSDIGSSLKSEILQQHIDKKYHARLINRNNIQRIDIDILQCVGSLMLNNTDVNYLRSFIFRLVCNNTLNLVYTTSKYPISVIVSTHDDKDTLHNVYGDTTCLDSYVANMLLNSEYNYRDLYIDDRTGIYSDIAVVKECMYTDKYINGIVINKNEYKQLGDTICNV